MTSRARPDGEITAADLMAQLVQDKEFQAAAAAREAELQQRVAAYRVAEQPIVADLHAVDIDVESVWDLVNTSKPYPDALPVLLSHLERGGYPDRVMEGLARALAVKPAAAMWERLRALYEEAVGPDEREGLATALAASASAARVDDLVDLVREERYGESRVHFVGAILQVGGTRGRAVVEGLRTDPALGAEAAAVLDEAR